MGFEERAYSALVVSSSEKFNESIKPILRTSKCDTAEFASSVALAKRMILLREYDFVIVNSPLTDDTGAKLAIDVSSGRSTVCLLLVKNEIYEEIRAKVTPYGVFTLPKPLSSVSVTRGIDWLAPAREILRKLEKKTVSIEEKMEEIRLVNRAKWLLIDHLKMTEPDAHRYIEKQAMDTCASRREIAESIVKAYG